MRFKGLVFGCRVRGSYWWGLRVWYSIVRLGVVIGFRVLFSVSKASGGVWGSTELSLRVW